MALVGAPFFPAALQSQRQQAFDIPKGTNVLFGRVLDAGSDAPIAGVVVNLTGFFDAAGRPLPSMPSSEGASPPRSVMTNGDGYFIFRNLPAGRYVVTPLTFDYIRESSLRVVELVDSSKPTSFSIRLSKHAVITGRVFDESGDPLAGVPVTALQRLPIGGRLVLRPANVQALTDDRGIYRLVNLPPGNYVIGVLSAPTTIPASLAKEVAADPNPTAAVAVRSTLLGTGMEGVFSEGLHVGDSVLYRPGPAPLLAQDGRVLSYATTLFPGTAITSEATLIALGSGEERSAIDLQLRLLPTVRVSGIVTSPDGPVPRLRLRLAPPNAAYPTDSEAVGAATAITNAAGAFTFLGIAPGPYELQVSYGTLQGSDPKALERSLWGSQPLTVGDSDIGGVVIALKPGIRVRGRFEFKSSTGAAPPAQLTGVVHLQPLGAQGWQPSMGRVAPDGTFQTGGDPPGRYVINASMPVWTLQGVTRNGRKIDDDVIELEADDVSGLVITFSDRPTRLAGSVVGADGTADAESHVVVFPADTLLWREGIFDRRERLASATSAGAFEIQGLPPGEYYVAAIRDRSIDGQAQRWRDPQFLERLIAGATKVTLAEGEERRIPLKTFTPRGR